MPSGEIFPADMDLDWTTTQASEYIIATWQVRNMEDVMKMLARNDISTCPYLSIPVHNIHDMSIENHMHYAYAYQPNNFHDIR